ncbi:MAG: calcium/sodium antiporter [Chloroflexota bacterium]|nr:calcium/sodium antiporter [Chloroflexota bacterium]
MIETLASLALILVSVYLLSVITEGFFIVSLDQISRRLNLSDEVAGASLMAMGSSAPELAIALIALFTGGGAHSDVGIGTIVGSAVFNILVITGVSAVVAGGLRIHPFAVRRDTLYYLLSIGYLAFIFVDGEVLLWEAILGLAAYIAYVLLLVFYKDPSKTDLTAGRVDDAVEAEGASGDGARHQIESAITKLLRLITGAPEKNYLWTFIVAIALIVALSYILVEATIVFAAGIGIPPVIVALTLLAAGTSAPDLISSIDVARAGRGGMAVANAIGSNIFDIFIGLGFPWVLAILLGSMASIHVGADGLWMSIGILVATTIILYVLLQSQRMLSRREGVALLALYLVYVLYTLLSRAAV